MWIACTEDDEYGGFRDPIMCSRDKEKLEKYIKDKIHEFKTVNSKYLKACDNHFQQIRDYLYNNIDAVKTPHGQEKDTAIDNYLCRNLDMELRASNSKWIDINKLKSKPPLPNARLRYLTRKKFNSIDLQNYRIEQLAEI